MTNEAEEELLAGGVNTVARVGQTIRRPTGPWTPAVHALLGHLGARGFDGAPRAHGIDEQGREVLDFVVGEVLDYPLAPDVVADDALRSVGRLLRAYHDATVDFAPPPNAAWYLPARQPAEVVCHGDFAPHNLVFRGGRAVAVIDFDTAHPGPRVWDFAWTAFCFGLSTMDESDAVDFSVAARIHRVSVLADAYGLTAAERDTFAAVTVRRLRHLAGHLREQAAAGHPGFSRHVAEGHDLRYIQAAEEIDGLGTDLAVALRQPSADLDGAVLE